MGTVKLLGAVVLFGLTGQGCVRAAAGPAELLDRMIREGDAPGVQYAFLDEEGVRFSHLSGSADLERGVPVGDRTTFNAYSLTKTFTAAAILRLASEGRLELDAPLSRYVPDLPHGRSPTLRQTLQHVGGFANPLPLSWVHPAEEHASFDERAFARKVLAENDHRAGEPGKRFAYSNLGYLLLGEVVREVSGRPFDVYVREELIAPLGLAEGEVLDFEIVDPGRHARGYIRRWSALELVLGWLVDRGELLRGSFDGWAQFRDLQVNGNAYGGLIGNAAGFTRYLRAILREEPPFSMALVRQLFTPGKTSAGEELPVGLAWFRGELSGEPYFAHAGGAGGYYCELRVYPARRRASVIMLNRTGISHERLLDEVDTLLLEEGGAR